MAPTKRGIFAGNLISGDMRLRNTTLVDALQVGLNAAAQSDTNIGEL